MTLKIGTITPLYRYLNLNCMQLHVAKCVQYLILELSIYSTDRTIQNTWGAPGWDMATQKFDWMGLNIFAFLPKIDTRPNSKSVSPILNRLFHIVASMYLVKIMQRCIIKCNKFVFDRGFVPALPLGSPDPIVDWERTLLGVLLVPAPLLSTSTAS